MYRRHRQKALHHLFAEVIDNSMDSGGRPRQLHRVELSPTASEPSPTTPGIPVDPHPKFKTSRARGHHDHAACRRQVPTQGFTKPGRLRVGVSVVTALSDQLVVVGARARRLYRQRFSRGKPQGPLELLGEVQNRRGTRTRFHPDPEIFGKGAAFEPARLYRMARSKAYLFGGVQIRWSCDPSLIKEKDDTPTKAEFHFPGGLKDYLAASLDGDFQVTREIFAGKSEKQGGHASLEWAVTWYGGDGFLNSYCNTSPTTEGGTHEAGFRNVLTRGLRAYGELIATSAPRRDVRDVMISAAGAVVSSASRNSSARPRTAWPRWRRSASWRTPSATRSTTGSRPTRRRPPTSGPG